jgi:hypothetical protein
MNFQVIQRPEFNVWSSIRIALVIAFMIALVAPAVAQKAKIEAVNAKWTELFNKGDFEGPPSSTPLTRSHFRPARRW